MAQEEPEPLLKKKKKIEGQSVEKHKFGGEKKTHTSPDGPPGSEGRKRDKTISQGKKFEKDGSSPRVRQRKEKRLSGKH